MDQSIKVGRFAPSPTGELHLGNLRTALAARRYAEDGFVIRVEDLDPLNSSRTYAVQQLSDLEQIGVTSDQPVIYQSDRFDIYNSFFHELEEQGQLYECFCTRREVLQAASAPHGRSGRYSGTCRYLTSKRKNRAREMRRPAWRLRTDEALFEDGLVDDIVLRRNDGVPAYNLAVVIDDQLQGVTQVVRGIDLEAVTPSQVYLAALLGFREQRYVHVGLVVDETGRRLAKRHCAPTLRDWLAMGRTVADLQQCLLRSLDAVGIDQEICVSDITGITWWGNSSKAG